MKREKTLVVVLILVVLGAVGFILVNNKKAETPGITNTSTSDTDNTNNTGLTATSSVSIKDTAFNTASITIKVGTTVTWTNNDDMAHTVTADTLSADAPSSTTLAKDDTYSFRFAKAGTYKYHCSLHPGMTGTVTVTE